MKYFLCVLLCACSAFSDDSVRVEMARRGLPARISIVVRSSDGQPIEGASVKFVFVVLNQRNPNIVETTTDVNGIARGEARVNDRIVVHVTKTGFYKNYFEYSVWGKIDSYKSGRWEPWNPVLDTTLYEIKKPREPPLLMETVEHLADGVTYGFDLLQKKIVFPDDKTGHADFYVKASGSIYEKDVSWNDLWTKNIVVSFNHPGDGLIAQKRNRTSHFQFTYLAPLSGYENPVEFIYSTANPEKQKPFPQGGEYLIFRVSRVNKESGELESFYGIIERLNHGRNWEHGDSFFSIHYRINTKPNDRNIEYN